MNQQVHEQNERLRSLESLITENQKKTENRTDQTEEATRQTQQMQQRAEVMFQQFMTKSQRMSAEGGDWPHRGQADKQKTKETKEHNQLQEPVA